MTLVRSGRRHSPNAPLRNGQVYGCLAERTSPTGSYEPKAQLDDLNSNQFSSAQGDSAKSSTETLSSSRCSEVDRVATTIRVSDSSHTILVGDSSHQAPRNRLRTQARKRRSSPEEKKVSSEERHIARNIRRYYKSHVALLQREHLHEEEMAQQEEEAARLRVLKLPK